MTENMLFVLGAADPEMQVIENLLKNCGILYAYAIAANGDRVHPGIAYKAIGFRYPNSRDLLTRFSRQVVLVECDGDLYNVDDDPIVVDHHRQGDSGYGLPPEQFLEGSSIGQIAKLLAKQEKLPWKRVYPVAENHYPGVQPGTILTFHNESGDAYYVVAMTYSPEEEDDPTAGMWWVLIPDEIILCAAASW